MYALPAAALTAAVLYAAFQQRLTIRTYTEISGKVRSRIRLALLTDLHSTIYGNAQKALISLIRKQKPDILLLAGDIADDKVPHNGTVQLLAAIGQRYPCYYVAGNHEFRSLEIQNIKAMMRALHIHVLEGNSVTVEINGVPLRISGIDDPSGFPVQTADGRLFSCWDEELQSVVSTNAGDIYSILLTHRPELTESYRSSDFDLVVAGHAHGGQVRIPGIMNGLYAPQQGILPKYAGGRYQLGKTALIVSRGLCKNRRPRVFNPPEVVVIDIIPVRYPLANAE